MTEKRNRARCQNRKVEPRAQRASIYKVNIKSEILDEIDRAQEPGEIGAIIRREGLYSQIIRQNGGQQRQRGPIE